MLISYSHLITVWNNVVSRKSQADIKMEKCLTDRVVIGYTVIDQWKCYCLKDKHDKDLSEDKPMRTYVKGYMCVGLDDIYKKGEWG